MPPHQQEQIIRDYLSGKDSPEGQACFEQWARKMYHDESFITSLSAPQLQRLEEKLFEQINHRIRQAEENQATFSGFSRSAWKWVAVAASLALLCVAGWSGYHQGWQEAIFPVHYREITALEGRVTQVQLPDGSRIQLQGGSKLRYPERFLKRRQREVMLSGEAYFRVAGNRDRPFVITTRQARVEVLGTQFNLKESGPDSSVVVAVEEGKVAFGGLAGKEPVKRMMLTANTVGVLTRSGQMSRINEEVSNYLSWINGRIVFRNVALPAVARQLERIYGVRVILREPELAGYSVTLNMGKNQLPNVLELMTTSLNLTYHVQGDHVTIYKP